MLGVIKTVTHTCLTTSSHHLTNSDRVVGDGWMSPDCPGWPVYRWCTGILRHSGWCWWMSTTDYPELIKFPRHTRNFNPVVWDWWKFPDCPGWPGILGHSGWGLVAVHGGMDMTTHSSTNLV